jgi:hypothetical protein
LAGNAALVGADRTVAVGVHPGEQRKRAVASLGARNTAIPIHVGSPKRAATEAGEHAAALSATALAPHATAFRAIRAALGAFFAAEALAVLEFAAVDHPIAVGVEAGKGFRPALAALAALAGTVAATISSPGTAGLAGRARFVLADEAVAIRIGTGEAGVDACFKGGAGQRLCETPALGGLGHGGGCGERGKCHACNHECLHWKTPGN